MNVYFHSDKLAGKADAGAGEAVDADSPLDDRIVDALRQVYDPEIPVNIYDLGLIYDVRVEDDGTV